MREIQTTAGRLMRHLFPGLTSGAAAVVAAVTVGFTVMFVLFPTCSDDFWYMLPRDSTDSVWSGLWEIWRSHWLGDNIRLANIIFSLFLLLPKWVGSLLAGLCVAPILTLLLRTAAGPEDGSAGTCAAVWMAALFTLLLPWYDQIAVMCFQFNYIGASLLSLIVLFLFLDRRRRRLWVYLLTGFVAGWWHEGFSVPLVCALTAAMALRPRQCLGRRNVLLVIGLAVGTALLLTAPGATGRMNGMDGGWLPALLSVVKFYPAAVIFGVLLTVCLLWRRTRSRVTDAFCIVVTVVIAVNIAIHLFTAFAPRIGWCASLFAIAGIGRTGRVLRSAFRTGRGMRVAARTLTAVVAAVVAVHLVAADIMTVRVRRTTDYIYTEYQKGADRDGVVFADFPTAFDAPFIALQKPYYDIFTYWWNNVRAQRYFGRDVPPRAVPAVLEDVDGTQGEAMPGGVRRTAGVFYVRDDGSRDFGGEERFFDGEVLIGGRYVRRQLHIVPFVSRRDGQRYLWIYPINTAMRAAFSPVGDIRPAPSGQ